MLSLFLCSFAHNVATVPVSGVRESPGGAPLSRSEHIFLPYNTHERFKRECLPVSCFCVCCSNAVEEEIETDHILSVSVCPSTSS